MKCGACYRFQMPQPPVALLIYDLEKLPQSTNVEKISLFPTKLAISTQYTSILHLHMVESRAWSMSNNPFVSHFDHQGYLNWKWIAKCLINKHFFYSIYTTHHSQACHEPLTRWPQCHEGQHTSILLCSGHTVASCSSHPHHSSGWTYLHTKSIVKYSFALYFCESMKSAMHKSFKQQYILVIIVEQWCQRKMGYMNGTLEIRD